VGWNGRWLEVELVEEGAEEAQLDLCQYTYYERMVRFEASKTVSGRGCRGELDHAGCAGKNHRKENLHATQMAYSSDSPARTE
jgi:hypothetical protein